MIASSIKAKLLVFVVFFMGIFTGVLIANFYTTRVTGTPNTTPQVRAQRDINKFWDYLGLDQPQREEMRKIGEETRHEFQELRKETQPRFQAIEEESRTKIRAVLNDEQRAKYDEFRRKMDARRQDRNRDGNKTNHDAGDRGQRPN
jgi:hypothetical protein